jgi:AbrB family looped-hinge helix DNA binding protein
MKTTLGADGQIGIPQQIRDADHLAPGDAFELERVTPGHYLLAKLPSSRRPFTVVIGEDGLPLIRVSDGIITSQLVGEIESQTP